MNVVNVDIAKNQKSQNYKRELMITREMEEKAHAAGRKNAKTHLDKYGEIRRCNVKVPKKYKYHEMTYRRLAFMGYSEYYYQQMDKE